MLLEGVGERRPCPEPLEPHRWALRPSTLTRPSGGLHDHPRSWLAVRGNSDGTQVAGPRPQRGFKVSSQEDAVVVWHRRGPGPRLQKDSRAQKSVCVGGALLLRPWRARGHWLPFGRWGQDRRSSLPSPDLRWSPDALWVVLGGYVGLRGLEELLGCSPVPGPSHFLMLLLVPCSVRAAGCSQPPGEAAQHGDPV